MEEGRLSILKSELNHRAHFTDVLFLPISLPLSIRSKPKIFSVHFDDVTTANVDLNADTNASSCLSVFSTSLNPSMT